VTDESRINTRNLDRIPFLTEGAARAVLNGYVYLRGSDYNWDTKQWEPGTDRIVPAVEKYTGDKLLCSKCNLAKDTSEFHKRPDKYSGGRGYAYHCKDCIKESKVG
jgi:hypothetical protein